MDSALCESILYFLCTYFVISLKKSVKLHIIYGNVYSEKKRIGKGCENEGKHVRI